MADEPEDFSRLRDTFRSEVRRIVEEELGDPAKRRALIRATVEEALRDQFAGEVRAAIRDEVQEALGLPRGR